ncbi:hypothetical protein HDU82_005877, partial [Entophlyctis luteolus]
MAFTGSILRELGRAHAASFSTPSSAGPLSLSSSYFVDGNTSHRVLAAQAAALDALAAVLARFKFGSAGGAELVVADSVANAASLSAELAAAAAPPSAAVVLVAHGMLNRAQDSVALVRNSPSLAIDTWRSLISMLKTALSNAKSVLPYAGGVALAATAAAIAFHVLTVRLPDWRKYLEGYGRPNHPGLPPSTERADPASMSIAELTEEVTALRAEIDLFRLEPIPASAKAIGLDAYADASESHIRSLEQSNAMMKDNIAALTKELELRSKNDVKIAVLNNALENERHSVQNLLWEVESLKVEKESQSRRVVALENSLDELRELFVGMHSEQQLEKAAS